MPSPITASPILKKIYLKGYNSAVAGEEYTNPYLDRFASAGAARGLAGLNARHYAQGYRDGINDRIMGKVAMLLEEVVYYL